ncbi:hypothetical protein CR513_35068, partial [Mucuna pruriens]
MDIDYSIRKVESCNYGESNPIDVMLYEQYEQSNRLSVMFIKTKISIVLSTSMKMSKTCSKSLTISVPINVVPKTHFERIMESRNVKFLDNDLMSRNDQFKNLVSKHDHVASQPSTSNDRLVVIHNTLHIQIDNDKQSIEQHDPQENVDNIKRSTRKKKSTIHNDNVVCLHESDCNIGVENDPKTFT